MDSEVLVLLNINTQKTILWDFSWGLKPSGTKTYSKRALTNFYKNKNEFWNESWTNYNKIKKFSDIKLIPNELRILEIKKDYKNMEEMFFKDFPEFEEMLNKIRQLELNLGASY